MTSTGRETRGLSQEERTGDTPHSSRRSSSVNRRRRCPRRPNTARTETRIRRADTQCCAAPHRAQDTERDSHTAMKNEIKRENSESKTTKSPTPQRGQGRGVRAREIQARRGEAGWQGKPATNTHSPPSLRTNERQDKLGDNQRGETKGRKRLGQQKCEHIRSFIQFSVAMG
jgi:hypothetical protein